MTDAKLDPKSFSAEERAIVDREASRFHRDWTGEARYQAALGICEPIILARRAIFGVTESEGAKVEFIPTPSVYPPAETGMSIPFQIAPAQPEPAAPVENIVLDGATATRRKRELEEAVAAPVNAGRAVRRFGRMLSGLGGGEPVAPVEMPFLRDELSRLLNHHSRENHSNTPDFVLAGFLMDALCAWERATGERDTFFGQNPRFAAMVNGPERKQPEPTAPRPLSYPIATDAEEPAASSEMPEAVRCAVGTLREFSRNLAMRDGFYCARDSRVAREAADALKSWWRTHSQPAPVRMTPELEDILRWQSQRAKNLRRSPLAEGPRVADDIDATVVAVRAQAAEVVKLPKVRAYFDSLCKLPQYRNEQGRDFLEGVYAELDAAERV